LKYGRFYVIVRIEKYKHKNKNVEREKGQRTRIFGLQFRTRAQKNQNDFG
jgi:hypothetical protein